MRDNDVRDCSRSEVPSLLQPQEESFERFFQQDRTEGRKNTGLQALFGRSFPMESGNSRTWVSNLGYTSTPPLFSEKESRCHNLAYTAPLHLRLQVTAMDNELIKSEVEEIIFLGDLPVMTLSGTFVVSGTDRVVIPRLQRTPGLYIEKKEEGTTNNQLVRIIPQCGPWLDFKLDRNSVVCYRIDGKKETPAVSLFNNIGITEKDLWELFSQEERLFITRTRCYIGLTLINLKDTVSKFGIYADNGRVIVNKSEVIDGTAIATLRSTRITDTQIFPEDITTQVKYSKISDHKRKVLLNLKDRMTNNIILGLMKQQLSLFDTNLRNSNDVSSNNKNIITNQLNKITKFTKTAAENNNNTIIATNINTNANKTNNIKNNNDNNQHKSEQNKTKQNQLEQQQHQKELDEQRRQKQQEGNLYHDFLGETLVLSKTTVSNSVDQLETPETNNSARPNNKKNPEEEFRMLFPNISKFNLTQEGRKSLSNKTLMPDPKNNSELLTFKDIVAVLKLLAKINLNVPEPDNLDHLKGKRLCQVGELLEQQLTVLLPWLNQPIDSLNNQGASSLETTLKFTGICPISISLKDFFSSSHLIQLLDYTNPLARISHLRRLTVLSSNSSAKHHAGLDIRDVHYSHYGKICPVETPEGQSIGLVNSLTTHTKLTAVGSFRTPYRRIKENNNSDEIIYLSALEEESFIITTGVSQWQGYLLARKDKDTLLVSEEKVHLTDAVTSQIVSVAAALIPFLEHNDVNRALMGSNMQRQAVPCLSAERPLVSTGIERDVALDSRGCVSVGQSGKIIFNGPGKIIVKTSGEQPDGETDTYDLSYTADPHQSIFANYLSTVNNGDIVEAGEVIADSFSTDCGQLSLGVNVLVAFMPWSGFNFEDSVIVSERLLSEGKYTSAHLEEFIVTVWHTGHLKEKTTRTIRGKRVKDLDANGIITSGTNVFPGDVLVGKCTSKVRQSVVPEERLLLAILNERPLSQKDISSRVPKGVTGTVVDVRSNVSASFAQKTKKSQSMEKMAKNQSITNLSDLTYTPSLSHGEHSDNQGQQERRMFAILKDTLLNNNQKNSSRNLSDPKVNSLNSLRNNLSNLTNSNFTNNQRWFSSFDSQPTSVSKVPVNFTKDNVVFSCAVAEDINTPEYLMAIDPYEWLTLLTENQWSRSLRREHAMLVSTQRKASQEVMNRRNNNQKSMELPLGVTKTIKIIILSEKKLQPGDKMSGRHGNKGVLSKVITTENMPYLRNGRVIDIILNPLGVPSRMNIGQILETHLSLLTKLLSRRMMLMLCPKDKNSSGWCWDVLYQIHNETDRQKQLMSCNDNEIEELGRSTRRGIALPVSTFGYMTDKNPMKPLNLVASFKNEKRINLTTSRDQVLLTDGNTGEDHLLPTTVGYLYYFKLHHLATDKIHARSIGPYSTVTQQPLGGKAQFGGQRLGEMEVWALEAYGSAYNLQEMLTAKSDDMLGRLKMYENITTGNFVLNTGMPESFNVLVREVRALGIDLNAERKQTNET